MKLCNCVSVSVGVDAELDEDELSGDNVEHVEDVIVSQWREVSAHEKHEIRGRFDKILRPLGFETRLLVIGRANSLALYFLCMTLSALMGLRQQWRTGQLRGIIEELFTVLAGYSRPDGSARLIYVKRLIWPLADYERCLESYHSSQGKQTILVLSYCVATLNFCGGFGPHLYYTARWAAQPSPQHKRRFDRFSRFCWARGCDQ